MGTAAVQLAHVAGARVIGTSRTPEKLDRAAALGLDVGVSGSEWARRGARHHEREGGGRRTRSGGSVYLAGNLRVLPNVDAGFVVGVTGGTSAELDLRTLMTKRASITGTVLRARAPEERMALAQAFERKVVPLFERGLLHPVVDRTFEPEEAARRIGLWKGTGTSGSCSSCGSPSVTRLP